MKSFEKYTSFGMKQPGRSFNLMTAEDNNTGYRFGFNGKEQDFTIKGLDGAIYDYGFRIYDPRVGKFLSVDPIANEYPELTSYQFASNRPIEGIDLDGLEFVKKNGTVYYIPPKPGNGNPVDPMKAQGNPSAMELVNNQTIIHTVSFKEVNNKFQAVHSITKFNESINNINLKVGSSYKLRNGGNVSLVELSKYTRKIGFGANSGLSIKLNYTPADNKSSCYFLQSLSNGGDNATYDASSGSNPFYFPNYINNGNFQDKPGFPETGMPGTTETFKASLLIYEKKDDTYTAVGQLDYSFDVTYNKEGKATVSNIKQTFTDLSSASPPNK